MTLSKAVIIVYLLFALFAFCYDNDTMLQHMIQTGMQNALHICFDELPEEPKRILLIGGCRQRDFAQYLALLLPAVEIFVLDPDAQQVSKAKDEICCRFKFIHSTVEAMPFFPDYTFDLTIAPHLTEYITDWTQAMAELSRVTSGHLLITQKRPRLWSFLNLFPGIRQYFEKEGLSGNDTVSVSSFDLRTQINRYGKVVQLLAPWPWIWLMIRLRPIREEKLVLEPSTEAVPV